MLLRDRYTEGQVKAECDKLSQRPGSSLDWNATSGAHAPRITQFFVRDPAQSGERLCEGLA